MHSKAILAAAAAVAPVMASGYGSKPPSLKVPACPKTATASYDKSVPDLSPFPRTEVALCYDDAAIHLTFSAFNETNFYFNPEYTTNGDIWEYEVMEAFISRGTADPQTYLELEVSPNNVTYQAFIYNPTKVRAEGAPFDHAFISDPLGDGMTAETTLDKDAETWVSSLRVPLGLFNVDDGKAKGTEWRMNFFRTVTSPETFPDQELGGWSPPDKASFHMTPFFGHVKFV